MKKTNKIYGARIRKNDNIYTLKIKTESNGLGILKTLIVLFLIFLQAALLILSYVYLNNIFKWYSILAVILTVITCIYVLSSDYYGQAKAMWVVFLITCYSFGYAIFLMSNKKVLFSKSRKKMNSILKQTEVYKIKNNNLTFLSGEIKNISDNLYNSGKFVSFQNSKTTYFSSGTKLFDSILENLEKAKDFIFIEFFIISNGVLLNRFLSVLKEKASQGVDVRIIYDDMGSHGTLKRKTKKKIKKMGIKLQSFNRLVPIFNIALNLRDHRKIIIIDGKVSYTGGANLADEYINEKRMHGYWKDSGIKIEGKATDNFTIAFLEQWQFLTNEKINYDNFINKAKKIINNNIVIPFVSGPNNEQSIAENIYINQISNAKEKLYIMTPYFVPDETITNLLINKAKSGVDVRLIFPDVADKKFVYVVSRNNAEKLTNHGIKVYTMTNSFVHSKVILNENSAIVGSINMDLRSFNQQFESAVFTNEIETLQEIEEDFNFVIKNSEEITINNKKRNKLIFRIWAGIFNLISPFM